jgi:hypothetical protein
LKGDKQHCCQNDHGGVLDTQILNQTEKAADCKAKPGLNDNDQLFESCENVSMSTIQKSKQQELKKQNNKK